MKKNENRTFKFLKEILGDVEITHPYCVHEKIYDEKNMIVRHYVLVDFYFKLGNEEYIVEYDGSQHHRAVKKWGGKETLRKQRIRDKWLAKYCKDKNIKLITIDGRKIRGLKIKAELDRHFYKEESNDKDCSIQIKASAQVDVFKSPRNGGKVGKAHSKKQTTPRNRTKTQIKTQKEKEKI